MVQGLENFDPYAYLRKKDKVEKGYGQAVDQFFGGKTPFDQISGIAPTLGAINNSYANNNRLMENALTSGSGAFGNADLQRDKLAQLTARSGMQEAQDKMGAVSDYRKEATQGYEGAHHNRMSEALGAGALGLQGEESALQNYLGSFKPPTGMNASPFSRLSSIAGLAAAPFTGGASLGAMASPAGQGGSIFSSLMGSGQSNVGFGNVDGSKVGRSSMTEGPMAQSMPQGGSSMPGSTAGVDNNIFSNGGLFGKKKNPFQMNPDDTYQGGGQYKGY